MNIVSFIKIWYAWVSLVNTVMGIVIIIINQTEFK